MATLKANFNIIILFCIFLIVNACNKTSPKVIVENKTSIELLEEQNKIMVNNKYSPEKVLKKKLNINESTVSNKKKNNDVVFEFKNERMLQGRNKEKPEKNKKTNKALNAVFKMFKRNLSSGSINLNLNNNETIRAIDYSNKSLNTENFVQYKNILVFLPFTGPYANFALKIRKSLDITILRFGSKNVQIIYFDTGIKNYELKLGQLLENVDPHLIIGPFTRESLLKIKPFVISKSIPMFTFSNDIALIEKNIWSLGFSPEEQVDSVISCALKNGNKKFGLIVPNNLYGNIVLERSVGLITKENNYFDKLLLSNKQLNNKPKLFSNLKQFLNYKEKTNLNHTKFDSIFIGGSKEFILEIAPLLAFYNVDSRQVQILGTEKFNIDDIKNEPSLEKAWFPIISNNNIEDLKLIWNDAWNDEYDYFKNAGFDAGLIGINYLNQDKNINDFLKSVKSFVNGFIFNSNGSVKKPISVMQIEKLGKLKNIKICNDLIN
ncbi:penicillin-binding protein activator [Alphaproteobacteria bacterium]|nr:penicillin-binding protein activator [Alphaproteobacteria bacterium]